MSTAMPSSSTVPSTGTVVLTDPATVHAALPAGEPAWLGERRAAAATRFERLGLPTRRDEEWRYTSLRSLEDRSLQLSPVTGQLTDEAFAALAIPGLDGPRLVFVDGVFDAGRSRAGELPAGVTVRSLSSALTEDEARVRELLGAVSDQDEANAFVALNDALMSSGVVVTVADDVTCETPIHIQSITTGGGAIANSRNLIALGAGASITVVEDHATTDPAADSVTNAVTEITVGDRGHAHHVLIERESEAAVHVAVLKSRQGAQSNVDSHSILLGGRIVRNEVHPCIEGEGSDSLLNGIYVPRNEQHMDNHMRVEHRVGHCTSRQYYRGMLADASTGIFSGRIVVADGSSETDAIQNCQNLLLSDDARAVTKPQLEIYDADVRCTHGATTGQLVPEQLFYLRARGISEAEARGLLVYAFAGEGIDRLPVEPMRAWVHDQFRTRLPYASDVVDVMD